MLIEWFRHREKTETSLWGQESLRHNTNRALTPLGWLRSTVIIHDAEIQVNPLLPGAMPQFPEGPRRDPHKHCDRYLSSLWARQQQLACLHGMQMALHGEERPTALLLAEQTWTAMGRKPAEKQTEGSGQRGRSRNIFHRSNTQWQKMLIRLGPAFSDWTNNTWVGIGWEPGGSRVGAYPSPFSPLNFFQKDLWNISDAFTQDYRGSSFTESKGAGVKKRMMGEKEKTEDRKEKKEDLKWVRPGVAWVPQRVPHAYPVKILVLSILVSLSVVAMVGFGVEEMHPLQCFPGPGGKSRESWESSSSGSPNHNAAAHRRKTHEEATCLSRALWFREEYLLGSDDAFPLSTHNE